MLVDLQGAIDLHVHTHPCLFPRICDDFTAVQAAAGAGMGGIVLKCHHESTVSRAREVSRQVEGFHVFGGIVLNTYVGGINPAAVEAALKMGGKVVWMPTIDADYHARIHGSRGKYDVQEGGNTGEENGVAGISIFDSENNLTGNTLEVLKLVASYGAILATCHLAPEEIFALVQAARSEGIKKILITHPFFKVPKLSVEQLKELVALGATAEFGYCTVSPMWHYATIEEVFAAINTIGVEHAVLISDAGQRHNPMPQESLRVFAQCLFEKGLTEEEIRQMVVKKPAELLGIEAR
ncbi:DUF6282 family protein [Moorella sp. Hama-1]|uniref:DUF6282 family protein n=1 Tax=Moorella sp. Hama-1 TaxID=2138101 RepID=UPI000D6457A9|nr:DUF6282 family protein [Moorella sp. Hama-1]BCV21316.1 hypothetical protein hamaS1_13850 [Moorella sp. Hama-1]